MTNSSPLDPTLIARYLANECTDEERAAVDQTLREHPEAAAFVKALRRAGHTATSEDLRDVDRGWEFTQRRIPFGHAGSHRQAADIRKPGLRAGDTPRRRSSWPAALTTIVACLVVLIVGVVGWRVIASGKGRHSAPSMLTYATADGQRATITLPDGGTVALNVASRLEVPMDYMAGNHTVRLVGQGIFTVQHHDQTPFAVTTGGTTVRVLGTTFMVRKYRSDTTTLVAVRDGKVGVNNVIVTANRQISVTRGESADVTTADPSAFSFAAGILTLNNVPLPTAIVELDRWFNVDIRLGSPVLRKQSIDGKFVPGSPADLASLLAITFDVRVVRDGRVLTLYSRS